MSLRFVASLRRSGREVRPTLALALPIMSGMVAQMLMGVTDTIMVGRVGVVPLAASAFVNAIAHPPFVLALGLLSAVAVLTSQAYGAKEKARCGEVLRHGLVLALAAGLLTLAVLVGAQPYLSLLRQPADVVAASRTYLVLFGVSLLPALVAHGCKQFCEALNRPWIPNCILLGAVLLNALLNWVLIYGHWGAPGLGLEGAGWATVIARTVMAACLIGYAVKAPVLSAFQPARWWGALHRSEFAGLLRIGWPVGLQHLLEVGAFVFAALMMGWVSADAIAAHQIAITCAATTFMFPLGIGMAASIRVGHAWGAGQHARMRRIGFVGISLAAVIMTAFAAMFAFAGEPLARLFVHSPVVVALAAQLLLVAAVFQVADGVQIAALSALRGLSDVRVPAIVAALAYWLIAVPLAYALAFPARHGAVGIWVGLASGLAAAAVGLSWRFHLRTQTVLPRRRPLP